MSLDRTDRIWDAHLETRSVKDLLTEACTRLLDFTKLTRDEMRLAGHADGEPEIDVCQQTEGAVAPRHVLHASGESRVWPSLQAERSY